MSTEEIQRKDSSDPISYVERFEQERITWSQMIKEMSSKFKIVADLVDLQVDLYSNRQIALEYMQQLNVLLSKLKKSHISAWKKEYESISINEDYRYNEREKVKIADEKVSTIKLKMDILQNHIDFFKETIKGIDSMIFGVKHRIEIQHIIDGSK